MKKICVISFLCLVLAVALLSCKKDKVNKESADNTPITMTFTSATVTSVGTEGLDFDISFKGDGCSADFRWSGSRSGGYSYNSDPSMMYYWHSGRYSCSEGSGSLDGGDLQISSNGANFSCTSKGRSVSGSFTGSVTFHVSGGGGPVK